MESVNNEIKDTFEGISHQHKQIKFFCTLFIISITGFFTLATFLTKDNKNTFECKWQFILPQFWQFKITQ
ncbi:MAG: hypothetical protein JXR90_12985 [Spirochaetes bacterium]|nr:hypothetical protein [Spirochaetota bacterium]